MRRFATLVVAAGILAAAYAVTFGLPPWLSELTGSGGEQVAATSGAAPQAPAGGRPGRGGPGGRSATTVVVTTPLELRPYDSVLSAIGTASALRSVEVVSESAGTVTEANLAANRAVEAGDVLLRLDARTEVLNLEIAQAQLEKVRDTVTRYERLKQSDSSTVTDVTLSEARLDLRLAEAAVGLAEVALEDKTIRAPISGRLGLSDIEVGATLSANSVITSIDQSDVLVVEFELPERSIGMLAGAKEVLATTSTLAGRVFTGTITSYDSRVDPVTRSVTVKAQIDNSEGLLWPGMTFAVRLEQISDPLPALPSTAITWSRSGSSVWIDADGVAEQVPVTILYRRDDTVWIDADIPVGTQVVTEGAQKLRAGAKLSTGAPAQAGTPPVANAPPRPGADPGAAPEAAAGEPT
ncbi:efflux RND transporter periplasmic adaptor subunit [Frigidibacter sp. ROC022]|uniref:efflux RND transporter periplasmic adaptor subunit n=1 Tax=Frigidibacter sp. ROC022 TaxID=2971796 RepID=UPI00215AE537|nr:efflux RND transporter periplasmic adaptor subunit [Frigidibacter sp. ROC022]MCR8723886.1 efflux RND transporter periplasmic adaptor subunit [Frigidibacter sp. ROC022]